MTDTIEIVIAVTIAAAVALWVVFDANSRGMNPWAWGLFTFLLLLIGLPVYLIARKPKIGEEL